MLGLLITYAINLWRLAQNGWRRLWRRRVDYVRLEIRGTLPEFAEEPSLWQRLVLGARPPSNLMQMRRQLQRIGNDPQARGVVLIVRDFTPGWATAQSLRDELHAFRARGKRVVVYLLNADTRSYFAACVADEVLMPPTAFLNLLGVRVEALFLRDAFCMLGIEAEVTAVSPYKSGGDQFARSNISPENREQLERLIDQRFETLITAIANDRNLDPERVRILIDTAPHTAEAACKVGLIDGVCYEDELEAQLAPDHTSEHSLERKQHKVVVLEWHAATRALRVPYRHTQRRYVAVVSVEGAITTGNSRTFPLPLPLFGGAQAGSDSIAQALRRVERNKRIAALVLHVDSPGGDAFASDLIWREVLRVRQHKPVVVSMGNVAASGGYYVSACANAIVAQPNSLTGSIGVYALRPVASTLLQRLGVNTTVLSRGARTGLFAATQPPTDEEREVMRQTVFAIYDDFKQRVCEGRRLTEEQLEPVAGGRVWTGHEAQQNGLVDDLGGLPTAIARARTLAHLPDDPDAPILRITAGKRQDRLLPQPFRTPGWMETSELLEEMVRPRLLAILPWVLKE